MAEDGYPKRESHFAHKLTRLLGRTCAAQEIGHAAWCLIAHIVHTEDAARYRRPVTFWNYQLESVLSLSWDRLDRARKRAIKAGWLHYERQANRSVGRYWTLIPPEYQDLPDTPVDEDFIRTSTEITPEETLNNGANIRTGTEITPEERRNNAEITTEPSTLTLKPDPSPNKPTDLEPPKKNDSKIHFTEEDSALAKFMFARIQDILPNAPVPIYGKWANAIRLMRERDGRTHSEIRRVFEWANKHHFWKANIRSPDKLRTQFDTLTLQMGEGDGRSRTGNATGRDGYEAL